MHVATISCVHMPVILVVAIQINPYPANV